MDPNSGVGSMGVRGGRTGCSTYRKIATMADKIQDLVYAAHAAMKQLPESCPAREKLRKALEEVEQM